MQKNRKKGNLSNLPLEEEEEENVPNGNWKERGREENKGPFFFFLLSFSGKSAEFPPKTRTRLSRKEEVAFAQKNLPQSTFPPLLPGIIFPLRP